jgi:hypothetical protein
MSQSWKDVDLKLVREFVAIMICGTSRGETDSFTLVDWKIGREFCVSNQVVADLFLFMLF